MELPPWETACIHPSVLQYVRKDRCTLDLEILKRIKVRRRLGQEGGLKQRMSHDRTEWQNWLKKAMWPTPV